MLETGGGAVVNISSAVGRLTGRGYAAYGTAKAALSHLTRLLASDLAPRVRVNAIAVGATATSALEIVLTNDELHDAMVATTPLKRLGEVEDIAIAVLYLASPAGGFLTGKVLEVDGGIEQPNYDMGLPGPLRQERRRAQGRSASCTSRAARSPDSSRAIHVAGPDGRSFRSRPMNGADGPP